MTVAQISARIHARLPRLLVEVMLQPAGAPMARRYLELAARWAHDNNRPALGRILVNAMLSLPAGEGGAS